MFTLCLLPQSAPSRPFALNHLHYSLLGVYVKGTLEGIADHERMGIMLKSRQHCGCGEENLDSIESCL